MMDIKKFLMIGGGLGFVYGGALLLSKDAFTTASFILYGNRWTIPVWSALIITIVTAFSGVLSVWLAPYLKADIEQRFEKE